MRKRTLTVGLPVFLHLAMIATASALHFTSVSGPTRLERKAALNAALMEAADYADTGKVRALLREGADVEARDPNGRTALMHAAVATFVDLACVDATIRALVQGGSDINARDADGETALMLAAGPVKRATAVETLIDLGADINVYGPDGGTALDRALGAPGGTREAGEYRDTVRALVKAQGELGHR